MICSMPVNGQMVSALDHLGYLEIMTRNNTHDYELHETATPLCDVHDFNHYVI